MHRPSSADDGFLFRFPVTLKEFNGKIMSRKALLALCVVIILPFVSYFVVKVYTNDAITIPPRLFADTVITTITDGKETTDTVWHTVSNITLTNQLGKRVSLDDLKRKALVVDFFFTRCPSICPTLTRNMKKLHDALKRKDDFSRTDSSFVQFLSISVDPDRDSVAALKKYADRFGVDPDIWWMLTGPKKSIYDFAINELKLAVEDGEYVDSNYIHTSRFVLLDKERIVRGYYDGLDSAALNRLAADLIYITLEKDKTKRRNLFRK